MILVNRLGGSSVRQKTIMAGDEGRVSKRSRFDQTEEPKRSSRFDRRSRSPVEKDRDAQRERSTPADETSAAPTPAARPDAAAIAGGWLSTCFGL